MTDDVEAFWPDPANPGVPLDPTESGFHWVYNYRNDDDPGFPVPEPAYWNADEQTWEFLGDDLSFGVDEMYDTRYVAPCKFTSDAF